MRKTYLDNIRWITVSLVVIYHVIYIFNGVTRYGIIGPFRANQPQDLFQYMVGFKCRRPCLFSAVTAV